MNLKWHGRGRLINELLFFVSKKQTKLKIVHFKILIKNASTGGQTHVETIPSLFIASRIASNLPRLM